MKGTKKKYSISSQIVYEDNHLIAINKASGQLSQGDKTGDKSLIDDIKEFIKIRDNKPGNVFVQSIHRLDRPTTGLIIFAKTSKATTRMNSLFRENSINKSYLAITHGRPNDEKGRLRHYLIKNTRTNIVRASNTKRKNAKIAVLDYSLLAYYNKHSLIAVSPQTGRSHQIRVQLSAIKVPILGDLKYGSAIALHDRSIGLHCHSMSFIHPIKNEPIRLLAKPPNIDHWNMFKTYFN